MTEAARPLVTREILSHALLKERLWMIGAVLIANAGALGIGTQLN